MFRPAVPFLALLVSVAGAAAAPAPIPAPPIPPPAQLGPVPSVHLPGLTPPPKPAIDIPDLANLTPVTIPPDAAVTPAVNNDPIPPPPSGLQTPQPATVSPGNDQSKVEEVVFVIEPGGGQVPASAEDKLKAVARAMHDDPASRLEVRVFSPIKAHSESTARRLSLARFIAIRDILVHNGISEGRVDGRALASAPDELNADRAELYIEH
jgi:hypothetical protein